MYECECAYLVTLLYVREKEERRKQGQTNKQAKQTRRSNIVHASKAVTFPKENELPQVVFKPTTLHTLDRTERVLSIET